MDNHDGFHPKLLTGYGLMFIGATTLFALAAPQAQAPEFGAFGTIALVGGTYLVGTTEPERDADQVV